MGQRRMRVDYDYSDSSPKADIRRRVAHLMDSIVKIERLKRADQHTADRGRLREKALERLEEAAMYAERLIDT